MSFVPPVRTIVLVVCCLAACRDEVAPRRTALTLGAPVVTVGVLHGDPEEMFGDIGAVVASPDGDFFVLDTQKQRVGRYDSSGAFRHGVGRPGSGPGEFRAASDLAVTPDGYLVVLDQATSELSVYLIRPDTLEYAHKHQLPFRPRQICAVAGGLFVLGLHESFALHEVTLAGRVRKSFAAVPGVIDPAIARSEQSVLREMFAAGHLACLDGRSPVVAYVPETFPVIRAFSANGRSLWQTSIEDYHEFQRSQDAQGLLRFRPDPAAMRTHHAAALSAIDGASFVLQLLERDYEREEQIGVQSRLVDAGTGRIVGLADSLPRLSVAVGRRLYAWRSDPFPRVFVFELPAVAPPSE